MTRFIPSEEIDEQRVQHWNFGGIKSTRFNGFSAMPEMTALPSLLQEQAAAVEAVAQQAQQEAQAELESAVAPGISEEMLEQAVQEAREQALEQGRQDGFAQGVEQGQQQAAQEWQARMADYQNNLGRETAQRLSDVVHSAQASLQGLQQQIAPDLLQLAIDIARQVVRQELRCNPQALQPVISEALDMLGAETKPALVRINPEDWKHLEAHVRAAIPNPRVEWLADASVAQGGCLVESQGAQVDGSIERRWQRAVAALGLVSTWYDGGAQHHGN